MEALNKLNEEILERLLELGDEEKIPIWEIMGVIF